MVKCLRQKNRVFVVSKPFSVYTHLSLLQSDSCLEVGFLSTDLLSWLRSRHKLEA